MNQTDVSQSSTVMIEVDEVSLTQRGVLNVKLTDLAEQETSELTWQHGNWDYELWDA